MSAQACTSVLRGGQVEPSRGLFHPACLWPGECRAQRRCYWRWYDELSDRELYERTTPVAKRVPAGPADQQPDLFGGAA